MFKVLKRFIDFDRSIFFGFVAGSMQRTVPAISGSVAFVGLYIAHTGFFIHIPFQMHFLAHGTDVIVLAWVIE